MLDGVVRGQQRGSRGAGLPRALGPCVRRGDPPLYRWFSGGLTNAAFNEVDRHVRAGHGEDTAFIVEGDHWDEAAGARS